MADAQKDPFTWQATAARHHRDEGRPVNDNSDSQFTSLDDDTRRTLTIPRLLLLAAGCVALWAGFIIAVTVLPGWIVGAYMLAGGVVIVLALCSPLPDYDHLDVEQRMTWARFIGLLTLAIAVVFACVYAMWWLLRWMFTALFL